MPISDRITLTTYLGRWTADYGMFLVLVLLAAFFSVATWNEQHPQGAEAARQLAQRIVDRPEPPRRVLVLAQTGGQARRFVEALEKLLAAEGVDVAAARSGSPAELRRVLEEAAAAGRPIDVIAATREVARWPILENVSERFQLAGQAAVIWPRSYYLPDFLKLSNLMAIADRIVVIALIAIGMTMVIITAGIDLSVGSLIAFSAVLATLLMRDYAGAREAAPLAVVLCCLAAIAACALIGVFSGAMVTFFSIPPFIVTLAMMLVARGLAFTLDGGKTIYQVPENFIWLGRGADLFGIPNTVVLMAVLYLAAYVLMSRTVLGRYIYAVGGNPEAARLSGVPVRRVLLFVYGTCAALAGLGGIVQASQLRSGAPTYGMMYELYVIAAVVVGGTSLAGGHGKVIGTLIGAFIIAVIQNGMNLTGVEPYTQNVVLGLLILAAVLLDMLKRKGTALFRGG